MTSAGSANINNNRNDDINTFLNENSVRNRLQSLAPIPNTNQQLNTRNLYNPTNLRSRSNLRTGSSFKLTLLIIMVPFVENNRIFTIHTEP
jgi:hypothetical protein